MNARSTALVAGDRERWPLAGDQLYVDLDLSGEHLPPGTRLAIGTAVLEVTADPHTGCKKFSARFGLEALMFVNSPEGRALNLRGINTRIVQAGTVASATPSTSCSSTARHRPIPDAGLRTNRHEAGAVRYATRTCCQSRL